MRISLAAAVLFSTFCVSTAFVPLCIEQRRGSTELKLSEETPKKLTSNDIINRARKAVGMPETEEAPKLFDDDLLNDMQQSLLALETRVKEGSGSLSALEVQGFEAATKRILAEMKDKVSDQSGSQGAPNSSAVVSPKTTVPPPSPVTPPAAKESATSSAVSPEDTEAGYGKTDMSLDESPAYDGTGGMGVARGTRNTYVIPGMDEMSPEEYRAALQKSVSDRQSRRHGSLGGVVGNRVALQYLDDLGAGGASGNWKSNEEQSNASAPPKSNPIDPAPSSTRISSFAPRSESRPHNPVPDAYEQVEINEAHKAVDKVANPTAAKETATSSIVPPAVTDTEAGYGKTDMSLDETPAYDGTGGMGVAKGTRNTYVIPGMDEMSPEEYRAALQQSVSNRQSRRHGKLGGVVGNRVALQYLDDLGAGGAAGNWKSDEEPWKEH